MRTLNAILALVFGAVMIGGCSAHARVGGKVGRRAEAPQQTVEKVAVQTHDVTTQPDAHT